MIPILLGLVASDAQVSKRPLIFHNWPPKNSKQQVGGKQRTLVVQIRSDQPVPLMFKGGRPSSLAQHPHNLAHAHTHSHLHALPHPMALHSVPLQHLRNVRPIKLSAPVYLKQGPPVMSKPLLRKPLKIKLSNSKLKSKPVAAFEKPFQFEKPTTEYYYEIQSTTENERNKLPLETTFHLLNDRYAPIHTIPAPNLSLQDNHLHAEDKQEPEHKSTNKTKTKQKSQKQQQQQLHTNQNQESSINNQYQVFEEQTNDQTIIDPHSNTQKLFAPDPDPSLSTAKLKLATEHFNQPSNGKPLPADVQSNHLPVAQALVLHQPELYSIQFSQQAAALQPFISANLAAIQPAAPIPLYNPTYLVQQSNNLYTQHKQQLFNSPVVEAGYYNADLTQAVAADGSIVQPAVDVSPHFAPLVAAQPVAEQSLFQPAAIRLPNTVVSSSAAPERGFVASNYYENDSAQLLQAFADEEAHHQRLESEQAAVELERQQQREQAEQELLLQQKHNHIMELQQQHQQQQQFLLQQEHIQQQQQLHEQQQHQQHQQHIQQQQQHQLAQQQHEQQQIQQHQQHELAQQQHQQQHLEHQQLEQQQQHRNHQHNNNPATTAFEEHARLVQKQLGSDTPLRIFVPDDEPAVVDLPRLQKREEKMTKGSVENADTGNRAENSNDSNNMGVEVSSSVEVSSENGTKSSVADKRMDEYEEQNSEQK